MSLEVSLRIRRYSDGTEIPSVDHRVVRRDYGLYEEKTISVGASRTEVRTAISDIQFIYAKVVGDSATVNLYKNQSPEWWEFAECVLMQGLDDCTNLSFKASASTTLYLFIAGD
jgi:hypothetical protein